MLKSVGLLAYDQKRYTSNPTHSTTASTRNGIVQGCQSSILWSAEFIILASWSGLKFASLGDERQRIGKIEGQRCTNDGHQSISKAGR